MLREKLTGLAAAVHSAARPIRDEGVLATLPLAALNHLLGTEDWAHRHLAAFGGQTVSLQMPPLALCLEITPEGFFRRAPVGSKAAVTLTMPGDLPLQILARRSDRAALLSAAQISGSVDLADCLGFIVRNLTWDVEGDLAPLLGDIAAHRLVQGARALATWQARTLSNVTRNLADNLSEEKSVLIKQHEASTFCRQTTELDARLSALEKRIVSLEDGKHRHLHRPQ